MSMHTACNGTLLYWNIYTRLSFQNNRIIIIGSVSYASFLIPIKLIPFIAASAKKPTIESYAISIPDFRKASEGY